MIKLDQKYCTANGKRVRLLCADLKGEADYPVVGLIDFGDAEAVMYWSLEGIACDASVRSPGDNLITVAEYVDNYVGIDAKVYVRDHDQEPWHPGHYAGLSEGLPTIWSGGQTSHTTAYRCSWKHCKIPASHTSEGLPMEVTLSVLIKNVS